MQPIRRILVAIKNPAARALPAVHKAAQIAKGLGAQLTLFHDIATPLYAEAFQGREAVDIRSWQREVQTARREQLEKLAARIRRHDIDVDVAADWDYPPYEAIIRMTLRSSADLVVIENHHGSQGRHPARWLLSYTDWELLRTCPVPVLLVKNRKLYRRPRVLAAIDPTHAFAKPANLDRQILRAGAQLVHALHGELHALHVYYPTVPVAPAMPDGPLADSTSSRQIEKAAERQLARTVDGFEVKPSHRHLVEGRPIDAIPRTAKRERSAIVAMGVVSRSGLKRFFIGNTAESVMDAVTADLLVVKSADFSVKVPRSGRGVQVLSLPLLPG